MKYIIHWIGGRTKTIEGDSIADAFNRAGLGAGAIKAVDYYESADKTPLTDDTAKAGSFLFRLPSHVSC